MLGVVGVVVVGQQRDGQADRQQRRGRRRQRHRRDKADRPDQRCDHFGGDELAADRVGEPDVL